MRERLTLFETIVETLARANHEFARAHIVQPRITIELLPDDWREFRRTIEPWAYPSFTAPETFKPDEVEIYGHTVKAYYPK